MQPKCNFDISIPYDHCFIKQHSSNFYNQQHIGTKLHISLFISKKINFGQGQEIQTTNQQIWEWLSILWLCILLRFLGEQIYLWSRNDCLQKYIWLPNNWQQISIYARQPQFFCQLLMIRNSSQVTKIKLAYSPEIQKSVKWNFSLNINLKLY